MTPPRPPGPGAPQPPPAGGSQFREHAPALVLAACLGLGMVADHFTNISWHAWRGSAAIALLAAATAIALCRRHVSSWALLAALAAVGGMRHHLFWSLQDEHDVGQYAAEIAQPVRMEGIIVRSVCMRRAEHAPRVPPWMRIDQSITTLKCLRLQDADLWRPCSGHVRLEVQGHLVHVRPGDRVQVIGRLARPFAPRNPGDFGYREWLRRQGLQAVLRCEHPASVTLIEEFSGWRWSLQRLRTKLRHSCELILMTHLSDAARPVARSILLGDRTELTAELRDQFTQSGTMHLLAISGLHVGLLLGMLLVLCRWINLGRTSTSALLLVGALSYAMITDQQPSVLRATLFAALVLAANLLSLPRNGFNTLGACAAALMLWNPGILFDIGAQLSFLAVGGIISSGRWHCWHPPEDDAHALPAAQRPAVVGALQKGLGWLGRFYLLSGTVWLVTAPLTMWQFHLLAPVGLIVNVLLIPYTALVLGLGFATLGSGLLAPVVAAWPAYLFDKSLTGLLAVVRWASSAGMGHLYLPTIPLWWVIGFYAALAMVWWLPPKILPQRRRGYLLGGWSLFGLVLGLVPGKQQGLTVTFLAVGHGGATVIELPDGRALLYDAGTFGDGRQAAQTIEHYLWDRRRRALDAVVVSHADVDHLNAVSTLLERIPVRTLFCHQSLLDFDQEGVVDLCESAARHRVPIRLIQQGDRLVGPAATGSAATDAAAVRIEVLHPPAGFCSKLDNANSVVLLIAYGGERLLLTGDVEGDGLTRLMQQATGPFSVVQAPHHGADSANPTVLYEWSQPGAVVASAAQRRLAERLAGRIPSSVPFLSTADHGAITIHIPPEGGCTIQPALANDSPRAQGEAVNGLLEFESSPARVLQAGSTDARPPRP